MIAVMYFIVSEINFTADFICCTVTKQNMLVCRNIVMSMLLWSWLS